MSSLFFLLILLLHRERRRRRGHVYTRARCDTHMSAIDNKERSKRQGQRRNFVRTKFCEYTRFMCVTMGSVIGPNIIITIYSPQLLYRSTNCRLRVQIRRTLLFLAFASMYFFSLLILYSACVLPLFCFLKLRFALLASLTSKYTNTDTHAEVCRKRHKVCDA